MLSGVSMLTEAGRVWDSAGWSLLGQVSTLNCRWLFGNVVFFLSLTRKLKTYFDSMRCKFIVTFHTQNYVKLSVQDDFWTLFMKNFPERFWFFFNYSSAFFESIGIFHPYWLFSTVLQSVLYIFVHFSLFLHFLCGFLLIVSFFKSLFSFFSRFELSPPRKADIYSPLLAFNMTCQYFFTLIKVSFYVSTLCLIIFENFFAFLTISSFLNVFQASFG